MSVSSNVCDTAGRCAKPYVWQFRTGCAASSGTGGCVAVSFGDADKSAVGVALGDIDGDGDLDAVVACRGGASEVWAQDGTGTNWVLRASLAAGENTLGVALGDFDSDGDLDIFWCCRGGQRMWRNDNGFFTDSGQILGAAEGIAAAVGDVDGDCDLDVVTACCGLGEPDEVWLNDGAGIFNSAGMRLGCHETLDISLADLNNDGCLDLIRATLGDDVVWFNGGGYFTPVWKADAGRTGGGRALRPVDWDGDGRSDLILLGYYRGRGSLWLNQGDGANFIAAGPALVGCGLEAGDLNGDGLVDAFFAQNASNTLWMNVGTANGILVPLRRPAQGHPSASSLGDLDGDGDLDAFLVNDCGPREIWLNKQ